MNSRAIVRIMVVSAAIGAYAIDSYFFRRGGTEAYFFAILSIVVLGATIIVALAAHSWLSIRSLTIGITAVVFLSAAMSAGGMFASCDLGMRPLIIELIAVFGPLALLNPLVALAFVGLCIGTATAIERLGRDRLHSIRLENIALFLVVTTSAVGFLFYTILTLTGQHPVPGNCVL